MLENLRISYISIGNKSSEELLKSVNSLNKIHKDNEIQVITDSLIKTDNLKTVNQILVKDVYSNNVMNSRYYKTCLNHYQSLYNIYIDSDTIIHKPLDNIYKLLNVFDLVIVPSQNQDTESFWHIDTNEREYTYEQLGYIPLQYQCGLFAWKQSNTLDKFFELWHHEWMIFKGQDQAAFVRALHKQPLRIYLLGFPYNSSSGSVIQHNFGRIR